MNKQKIKKIVPKLRFPEFRNTEEWEEMPLGKLGQTISGLSGKSGSDFGSGKPFVTYMQVYSCAWIDFTKCGRVLIADNEKQNTLQRGDILFTTSSETPDEVGFASVILDSPLEPLYLNSFCFAFRPDNLDVLRPEYSRYLFHSPIYRKSITVLAQGITRYNISKGAFLNLRLPIPEDEKEQQKIADCLSSIDELTTAETNKLDALKAHKKGLMQQFFPAEGETIPKLRFPEFRDKGEWERCPLKDVFRIFQGFAFSSNDSATEGTRWLKIADVSIQQMNHSTSSFLPTDYKEKYQKFLVKKGDYVMALTRPILSKELKLAQVDEIFHESLLNQRVGKLVTSKNIAFVYYLLQTSKLILDIEKNIAGSEPPNLSAQQIEDIETYIPTKKEQQKIADCLSSIDDMITSQNNKLDALKAHKKGLMQQLFPTKNESGK